MAADNFNRAKDLYEWNRYSLSVMGVWIHQPSCIVFTFTMTYLLIHVTTEIADLLKIFGDLDIMMQNLTEITLEIMVILKLIVLRFSSTLREILIEIISGLQKKSFQTSEELDLYLKYNCIAKFFFVLWMTMGGLTSIVYHFKPLQYRLEAVLRNQSTPFVLPYRTDFIFFEVNDSSTFWLVWLYQCPMMYYHAFHSLSFGFLFSLVLDVCGKLSALAFRIKSLNSDSIQASTNVMRDIVESHNCILRTGKDIDRVFRLLLLEELFISTVILGLTLYSALMHADFHDPALFMSFLVYGLTMLFLLYGYCVAGEYLITESESVCNAYYQCQWYDLSSSSNRQLVICIVGASKPLQLTGGGFYVFCMPGFTRILKTAMGYISMLRTMT